MTNSTLTTALFNGPATVNQLAAHVGLSESRVRELIKAYDNLQSDGGRPAKYWLEPQVEEPQTDSAGPEGTFLGDSVLLCHKCEKAHNVFSGGEVSLPKGRKSRKAPLNPQYKINAKIAAVEAAGGTLTYDKSTRLWALQLPQHKAPVLMTSREFSLVDHKTIVELD